MAGAGPAPEALRDQAERLAERSAKAALTCTGEVFTALHGGRVRGGRRGYRGKLDLGLSLDLERLGLWRGARVVLSAQDGHGDRLSERRVGDLRTLSNVDADRFTQLSEYWLEQGFFSERGLRRGPRARVGRRVQLGWAPRDRNEIRLYGGGRLAYRCALSRRPDDVVGLGVAHARLGGSRRGAAETPIELLYQARLNRTLALQPDPSS